MYACSTNYEEWFVNYAEGSDCDLFLTTWQHLTGRTEKIHERVVQEFTSLGPLLELGTFQTLDRRPNRQQLHSISCAYPTGYNK
jgi:hypothetical protein